MKIVFFGTSNFAIPILEALYERYEVVGVVTAPDAKVGRNQQLSSSPTGSLAQELGIPTFKPERIKDNTEFKIKLEALEADLFIVAAYGKIIPQDILDLPSKGALNVHPSLLPKYRGASPIQYALLNGEATTGTTIMLMDKDADHGPILTQKEVLIDEGDIYMTLEDKLSRLSAHLLLDTIDGYLDGTIVPKAQNHETATFTKIISKEDGKIDWSKNATDIYNQFRAFFPWPGIWTTWNGQIIKILDCAVCHPKQDSESSSGLMLDGGIVVCGHNTYLQIKKLQLAGKTETDIQSFLKGYKHFIGSRLE